MLISVSSSHKNIYREQFADFGLEKKKKDNFLIENSGKTQINTCVADFCSQKFQYKFHQKGSMSQCAAFCYIRPTKSPSPTEFPFFHKFCNIFNDIFKKRVIYLCLRRFINAKML